MDEIKEIKLQEGDKPEIGFRKILEAKMNGDKAFFKYGDYTVTTNMVPENWMDKEASALFRDMKNQAIFEAQKGEMSDKEFWSTDKFAHEVSKK